MWYPHDCGNPLLLSHHSSGDDWGTNGMLRQLMDQLWAFLVNDQQEKRGSSLRGLVIFHPSVEGRILSWSIHEAPKHPKPKKGNKHRPNVTVVWALFCCSKISVASYGQWPQVLRDRGEATLRRLHGQHPPVDVLCAVATLARQEMQIDGAERSWDRGELLVICCIWSVLQASYWGAFQSWGYPKTPSSLDGLWKISGKIWRLEMDTGGFPPPWLGKPPLRMIHIDQQKCLGRVETVEPAATRIFWCSAGEKLGTRGTRYN